MTEVIWKSIPSLNGEYEASSNGEIRNAKTGRLRNLKPGSNGYIQFSGGSAAKRNRSVHRLVCEAFHGPLTKTHVDHIDGNKSNNRPENLRNCTGSENARYYQLIKTNPGSKPKLKGIK